MVLSGLIYSGCATSRKDPATEFDETAVVEEADLNEAPSFQGLSKEASEALANAILEADVDSSPDAPAAPVALEAVPVEINERVYKWIHYFSVRDRERFQRFLERGARYRDVVEDILATNGVPKE